MHSFKKKDCVQYLLNKEWFDALDNRPQSPKHVGCNLHNTSIAVEVDAIPGVAKWKLVHGLPLFSGCLRISKILDGMLSHGFEVHNDNLPFVRSSVSGNSSSIMWYIFHKAIGRCGAFNLPMYVSSKYSSKSSTSA